MSDSDSNTVAESQSYGSCLDELNPHWENLRKILDKHPSETFKFINGSEGWLLEINLDLLGLPKETTMSSLYKE